MGYTSTEVKERYNKKTYTNWQVKLRNEVYNEIEQLREETGLSRAEFLKMLVNEKYNINL